jgi:hypothetical protein
MFGHQRMLPVPSVNAEKLEPKIGAIRVRINNGTFGYGCL